MENITISVQPQMRFAIISGMGFLVTSERQEHCDSLLDQDWGDTPLLYSSLYHFILPTFPLYHEDGPDDDYVPRNVL